MKLLLKANETCNVAFKEFETMQLSLTSSFISIFEFTSNKAYHKKKNDQKYQHTESNNLTRYSVHK